MPIEGSESVLEADVVIIAFGFSPTVPAWLAEVGVEGTPNGRIVAGGGDRLPFQTTHPKLFAGGDDLSQTPERAVFVGGNLC